MNPNTQPTPPVKPKPHFLVLDGLRGVAALVVLIFHFMEIVIPEPSQNPIMHGFLAVDFFFCLSGFVIAYAYADRLKQMSFKAFALRRLIRLHPLVVIGSVLGLVVFLLNPFENLYAIYGFFNTLWLFLASVFVVPLPIVQERYFNLFNLNAPMWSLFWEYVMNIVFALILFRLSRRKIALALGACAVLLCQWAGHFGNLLDGWGGYPPSNLMGLARCFAGGAVRVSFSFLMGMFLYQSGFIIKNRLGFWGLSALLLVAFFTPYVEGWNFLIEPFLVGIYMPLIVALGAGTVLPTSQAKISQFSGDISYPLYMTHYPFLFVFGTYVGTQHPNEATLWVVIPCAAVLLIGVAYVVFRWGDAPLRRYLSEKFLS